VSHLRQETSQLHEFVVTHTWWLLHQVVLLPKYKLIKYLLVKLNKCQHLLYVQFRCLHDPYR
jgi:hypothetical protein